MICPYIENEGYYSEWSNDYYETHQECILESTISVLGQDVIMSKSDFYMVSGTFGVLLSILMVWAIIKSIL